MESTNYSCKQMAEDLDAFRDHELSQEEHARVETHLRTCQECTQKLIGTNQVVDALKTIPPVTLSAEATSKLDALLERESKVVRLQPRVWAPIAAAAAVVVVVGLKMATPTPGPTPVIAETKTGQKTEIASQPAKPPIATKHNTIDNTKPDVEHVASQRSSTAISKPDKLAPSVPNHPVVAANNSSRTAIKSEKPSIKSQTTDLATVPKTQYPNNQLIVDPINTGTQSLIASKTPNSPSVTATSSDLSLGDDAIAADIGTTSSAMNDAIGISTDEDGLYDIKM